MAVGAGRGADRNVITGLNDGHWGACPALALRMARIAADGGYRRVIHRRALVTDHKARKGAGAVTALARRAADRDMDGPRLHSHHGPHVGEALSLGKEMRAVAGDGYVGYERDAVGNGGGM